MEKQRIQCEKIEAGNILSLTYYVKVKKSSRNGQDLLVENLDHSIGEIRILGKDLIEGAAAADQYRSTSKVTKTKAAEIMISAGTSPFTVCFEKSGGRERVLRGRLVRPEPLLGRSMVEDLDEIGNRLRQVDHRTIKWLIVNGEKYTVQN